MCALFHFKKKQITLETVTMFKEALRDETYHKFISVITFEVIFLIGAEMPSEY